MPWTHRGEESNRLGRLLLDTQPLRLLLQEIAGRKRTTGFRQESIYGGHRSHLGQPFFEFFQCQLALSTMTLLAVSNLLSQRRKQIERDIRWLEVLGAGMSHVVYE